MCPPLLEAGTLCEERWGPRGGSGGGWILEVMGGAAAAVSGTRLWESGQWLSPKV